MKKICAVIFAAAAVMSASGQEQCGYLELVDSASSAIVGDRLDKAEEFITRALELEPSNHTNVILLSNLGVVQYRNGKPEKAVESLDNALRMWPNAIVLLNNRAEINSALGRDSLALADYTHILEIDSLNAPALFAHGMLHLALGDIDTATEDFGKLKTVEPDSRNSCMAQVALLCAKGRYSDAVPFCQKLVAYDDRNAEYHMQLALCLLHADNLTESSQAIARAISLDPENPECYEVRAALHRMSYRTSEAEADLRKAAALRNR